MARFICSAPSAAFCTGRSRKKWDHLPDASNLWRKLPFVLLLGALLFFGLLPGSLTEKIKPSAEAMLALANGPTAKEDQMVLAPVRSPLLRPEVIKSAVETQR